MRYYDRLFYGKLQHSRHAEKKKEHVHHAEGVEKKEVLLKYDWGNITDNTQSTNEIYQFPREKWVEAQSRDKEVQQIYIHWWIKLCEGKSSRRLKAWYDPKWEETKEVHRANS